MGWQRAGVAEHFAVVLEKQVFEFNWARYRGSRPMDFDWFPASGERNLFRVLYALNRWAGIIFVENSFFRYFVEGVNISVIIPTLNEAACLAKVLDGLLAEPAGDHEVLVVDGGSGDATGSIAWERGARVITCSPAGRARQMNRGAEEAGGDVLFFLHGDTLVPEGVLGLITGALQDGAVAGGGFLRQFDSNSRWLEWTCRLADWRSEKWGVFLGDQGIFVRRGVFDRVGGFDEGLSRCEDLRFSMKLRQQGKVVALHPPLVSSARRFAEKGPIRTTLRDGLWAARFLLGS
jgi:rSAM/selenodomain-associated transferase 2